MESEDWIPQRLCSSQSLTQDPALSLVSRKSVKTGCARNVSEFGAHVGTRNGFTVVDLSAAYICGWTSVHGRQCYILLSSNGEASMPGIIAGEMNFLHQAIPQSGSTLALGCAWTPRVLNHYFRGQTP